MSLEVNGLSQALVPLSSASQAVASPSQQDETTKRKEIDPIFDLAMGIWTIINNYAQETSFKTTPPLSMRCLQSIPLPLLSGRGDLLSGLLRRVKGDIRRLNPEPQAPTRVESLRRIMRQVLPSAPITLAEQQFRALMQGSVLILDATYYKTKVTRIFESCLYVDTVALEQTLEITEEERQRHLDRGLESAEELEYDLQYTVEQIEGAMTAFAQANIKKLIIQDCYFLI